MPKRLLARLDLLLIVALSLAGGVRPAPSVEIAATDNPRVKIHVDAPGVYSVDLREVTDLLGKEPDDVRSWELTHRERPLPHWQIRTEGEDRLLFLVPTEHMLPPLRREGAPTIVLMLAEATAGSPADSAVGPTVVPREPPDRRRPRLDASVVRRRRFEQNLTRAPLDRATAAAGVESWWYWTLISHQSSSQLEIDLGELPDRSVEPDAGMILEVGLLGWSDPRLPDGMPDHHVDVLLAGEKVGEVTWSGRRRIEAKLTVPPSLSSRSDLPLILKIPQRHDPSATRSRVSSPQPSHSEASLGPPQGDTIIDLVYVDWLEVRYPAANHLADPDAPLDVRKHTEDRWLAGPETTDSAVAVTTDGDLLLQHPGGGWILPSRGDDGTTELWIVEPSEMRTPLVLESTGPRAPPLRADLDYLILAPRRWHAETERLADLHRRRGLRVAVVDAEAIYDTYGSGEKGPEPIRQFLDDQYMTSPGLRFLLLVGDADWLIIHERPTSTELNSERRNVIPTFVRPTACGPAASDHFYAAAADDPAVPRFAVGRLPVAEASELDAIVDKISTHLATPSLGRDLLMLSDASRPSSARSEKLSAIVADWTFVPRHPEEDPGRALDDLVIEALAQAPSVVHFGGHGARYQWQLGETALAGPASHFDLEDVSRLPPAHRWPVALSISCATAPFDHPTAASLGEAMVLSPERGAIAFLGAGVRLFTPQRFSEYLIRELSRQGTVGEAVVEAKRSTGEAHVAQIYNLLGDPAIPLR